MSRFSRLLWGACWVVLAGLVVVIAIRLLPLGNSLLIVLVQSVGMVSLFAALPVLIAAAIGRKRLLIVGASVLVVAQLVWIASAWGFGGAASPRAASDELSISSANMLFENQTVSALADQLLAEDSDVVVLQEVSAENLAALTATDLWQAYPYSIAYPHPLYHGSAVLSRLPMTGSEFQVAGSPMVQVQLTTPAGVVELIDVHTVAPLTFGDAGVWEAQLASLATMVPTRAHPIVMVGDFNATLDHAPLRSLLAAGMRDAFVERGSGTGATYPQWSGPSVLRLDHLLVSSEFAVDSLDTRDSAGSDHRHIVGRIHLTGQP